MKRSSADLVARLHVGVAGLAHAHPAALVEVLGGVAWQHVVLAVADLTGGARCRGCPRIVASSRASRGGTHAQPVSVITNLRRGKRSNTPESSMCTNGRWLKKPTSVM